MVEPGRKPDSTRATAGKLRFFDALTVDPGLTDLDCRVAWRLLHYFNNRRGQAWPSLQRLADEVHAKKRSVVRSVSRLEADGWFTVKRDERPGRGMSNRYIPRPERVTGGSPFDGERGTGESPFPGSERVTEKHEKGDSNGTKRVTEGTPYTFKKPLEPLSAAPPPKRGREREHREQSELGTESGGARSPSHLEGASAHAASRTAFSKRAWQAAMAGQSRDEANDDNGLDTRAAVQEVINKLTKSMRVPTADDHLDDRGRAESRIHTRAIQRLSRDDYTEWCTWALNNPSEYEQLVQDEMGKGT